MTEVFLRVLDQSLSASWVILAVLTAQFLLKKASKWLHCALWALVALRLLSPVSLESPFSLIPKTIPGEALVMESLDDYSEDTHTYFDNTPEYAHAVEAGLPTFPAGEGHSYVVTGADPVTPPQTRKDALLSVMPALWCCGIGVMLIYAIVSYYQLHRRVQASVALQKGIYLCDYIDSPFILGIIQPKVYLPSDMDPEITAYVLAHEQAHLARKDHWWKPFGYLLLSIHWFNPLLWAAYILLCRDIELACDEKVIKDFDNTQKRSYSEALLKCSVSRSRIAACPLAFGETTVKQRIKAILHYKKPGFWILLVSILVTIIVSLCFLTEPQEHTLANILEIRPKEITQITLYSTTTRADIEKEKSIQAFLDFLDTLEYDPVPASDKPIEGLSDENNWNYQSIEIHYEDRQEQILFNYDCTLVWTRDADGTCSLPYRLREPDRLRAYMNDHVSPVNNLETSAEPFARQDQPFRWLQGIQLDALRSAKCNDGYLSIAQTKELISILNRIPEAAIGHGRYFEEAAFDTRGQSLPYILLRDDANNLTAILTYYDDSTELSLIDSSDYDAYGRKETQCSVMIYKVDSSALRSFFTDLAENPPNILATAASGYRFNEKLEVLSHGDFTMSFHTLENWDYEIIRPEDKEDFFGFRCRPKKEDAGWITFGWWEEGFPAEYPEIKQASNLYGYHYTYSLGSPTEADPHSYYTRAHCCHGDFVIVYEHTDSWKTWYQDTANWLNFWVSITCELPHTRTEISQELAFDLANVAYFDWDAIAKDLGTTDMTLFHYQYYEDHLFVGCQYAEGYRIACFRKTDSWEYEFVKLLTPVPEPLPNDSTKAVPTAEFSLEDSTLKLYILQEESATGVRCHSGFWGYYPISCSPSLFVMDSALWEGREVIFDFHYEDPPQLNFHVQSNGSSFEFSESPQYYLYDGFVSYNDGKNPIGNVTLNTEQLQELSEVLLSLPALTQNYEPEISAGFGDITAGTMPKVHIRLRLDNTGQYLLGENGIQPFPFGDVRLELLYNQDNLILAVHMDDLDMASYRDLYYFTVDSPELEAFLLDTCHISRK